MKRTLLLVVACLLLAAPTVRAQGMVLYPAGTQFFDNTTGQPLAAGLLYTCVVGSACPGTTQNTWSDVALSSLNSNPITLSGSGRLPNAVYTSGAVYKLVLQSSATVNEFTVDNVPSPAGFNVTSLPGTTVAYQAASVLTLASNTITPTRNMHAVDTSGGAQNLNTINTSGVTAPFLLWLYGNNPGGNPVTLTQAGNIVLQAGGSFTLSTSSSWIELILRGSTWYEITRAPGSAAGKQTLWVPALAMSSTVTNGATGPNVTELTAGNPNITPLSFVNGATRNAQFNVAFPKAWNAGTVTFQAYWTGTIAGAGTTIWGLQCLAVPDGVTTDAAFGTAQEVTDTFLTVKQVHVAAESAAITISGAAADTYTTCQVYRKGASDTRAQPSLLLGVKLYYTTNAANDN